MVGAARTVLYHSLFWHGSIEAVRMMENEGIVTLSSDIMKLGKAITIKLTVARSYASNSSWDEMAISEMGSQTTCINTTQFVVFDPFLTSLYP